MTSSPRGEVLKHFRTLFDVGALAGLTDGQLVERFAGARSEAAELAFGALVERHGGMVWRVCQRVLRDPDDADDAFQATFLVLVRRAHSIRRGDSVASWLHGVALRVAWCVRASALRRRNHEKRKAAQTSEIAGEAPLGESADLARVLHEELGRLPGRLREVAVLCDLEGCTQEEAADRLGCPVGTVKSRLSTVRGKLRRRLERRGLAPAAGAIGAWAGGDALAAPTRSLTESTVQAAISVAAGPAAASGAVPARVAALTEGVLKAMFLAKLKVLSLAAVAVGVIGVGVAFAQNPGEQFDRLREVERKLDRLLEAVTPRNDLPKGVEAPMLTPKADEAPQPPGPPRTPPPPATKRGGGYGGGGGAMSGGFGRGYGGPVDDRLEKVEVRLENLERRIRRIEQQLGSGSPGGPPSTPPPPAPPTTPPTPAEVPKAAF